MKKIGGIIVLLAANIFGICWMLNSHKQEKDYLNNKINRLSVELINSNRTINRLKKHIVFLDYCRKSPIKIYVNELNNIYLISASDGCKCADIKLVK